MEIILSLIDKELYSSSGRSKKTIAVADNSDYEIIFDRISGLGWIARFSNGDKKEDVVLSENFRAVIPRWILTEGCFEVGIYNGIETSAPFVIEVKKSILSNEGMDAEDTEEPVIQQLIKLVNEIDVEKTGDPGFSPTVEIVETEGGHTVTVTDVNGEKSFDVTNGQNGADGKDGEKGDAGKTAYEYAQDGGYTGTEEEFAEKLAKEKFSNPNALTINDKTYDGSEAVSVDTREFVFNVTTINEESGECEVDVTAEQFLSAYNEKRSLICCYDGIRVPLTGVFEDEGIFAFLLIASATQSAEVNVHVNENEITALGHFSECSITINNQTFDGATSIDFTDTINEMIDEKSKDFETEPFKPSVINYGAKGDGSTDDTEAFQTALSENRLVYVPEGTYKLSDTLLVRPNCELELSQATHLKFTQTEDNCIELRSSATLRGNHAVIEVPYSFTGNVISVDTQFDEGASDTPPFAHWDPMWKRARYIYDVCIVKPDPNAGLHYSIDGTCSGTGIYLSAKGKHLTEGDINFIWGAILQGIRIAGAFTYGIQVENIDNPDDSTEDDAWNHDMRIEAVIQGCETGASLTNCNTAHLAVTIQPSTAQDGTKYAKWGVYLNDCRNIDMTSSLIWDWHAARDDSEEYQHIAMYGNCRGLVLSDFLYYENSTDIRKLIYTDTPSNLEKMTILQEPITRWFKPIDGVPYFSDGYEDKKLALEEDIDRHFTTDSIKMFEDVLSKAIDTDGSIYNEVGYKKGGYLTSSADIASNDTYNTYAHTGFIKCKSSDVIHVKGIDLATNDSNCRIAKYDSDFKPISQTNITMSNIISNASYYHYTTEYDEENDEYKITLVGSSDTAYIRISVFTRTLSEYPIITVNEDIKYEEHGFLADGIKVKAENVIGLPSDDGTDGTWESMPDKPFYEKGISYEWDGVVTEGMKTAPVEGAGLTFYKISDDIINHKEIVGATVKNFFDGKEVETIITSEMLTTFDSGAWIALSSIPFAVCTTKEDIITMMGITISFASAGIWFPMFDSNNEERTYFIKKEYELKKIDPKFLYQSDLSQNDETQPDYVKNRTHWSEITNEKVILSETLVEFTEENEGFFVFESQLVEGKKYKVIWNGNEYNYTAKTVEGVVAIGNLSYLNDTTSIIYEEPFAVANMDGAAVLLAFKELPLTANVIITEYDEIVHKLPDKFIDKEFRITATRNEDSSFLVDKTFSEVQKAHSDGKNITLAFISDVEYIYYLSHISDEQIEFMSLYMANQNDPIIRFAQLTRSDTFTIRSIDLTLYRNS